MGRARSNLKRRPKGKRGWRKIDANALLNPPEDTSLEAEQARILQSRDSQLWSQDLRPLNRKRKKLTKAQQKQRAKQKLLARGFVVNSVDSTQKTKKQITSYQKEQRLLSWKNTQPNKYNQSIVKTQPKQSAVLKFSNTTKKKVLLHTHKNFTLNKKHAKNATDYTRNNRYTLYKLKHDSKNVKHQSIKDLWGGIKSRKPSNKISNDESSFSETESDDTHDTDNDEEARDLPDVHAQNIIRAQRQRSKCSFPNKRSIHNAFMPNLSLLSLPTEGESINPIKHHYYYMKWRAFKLRAQQRYKWHYQKKSTERWYKDATTNNQSEDKSIEALREKANKFKKLYLQHKKAYDKRKELMMNGNNAPQEDDNNDNNAEDIMVTRSISRRQRARDRKATRMNSRKRKDIKRSRKRGHIWGSKYRFKARTSQPMAECKIGNSLRTTLHSGVDHPLKFMFNEMQAQNKVQGAKRNRFVLPKKKAFLGPRYKVQTRIGKLHHANVGHKYFIDIDD